MSKFCVYTPCDQTVELLGLGGSGVFRGDQAWLFDTREEAVAHTDKYSYVREIKEEEMTEFLQEDWTW